MKKMISVLITMALVLSLAACGNSGTTGTTTTSDTAGNNSDTETGEIIYGRVVSAENNTITIEKMNAVPEMNGDATVPGKPDENFDPNQDGDGTFSTMPSGDASGSVPAIPSGDGNGSTVPGTPGGNFDPNGNGDGTFSTMPSGDGNGGTAPGTPDGSFDPNQGGDGTFSTMPSGDASGSVPAIPGGDGNGGTIPENPGENGGMAQPGETITITVTNTSVIYKNENSEEVAASLDEITVGAMLTITYGTDSVIEKIVITDVGGMGGGVENPGTPGGQEGTSTVVYGGAAEITSGTAEDGKTYTSETADQSALYISTSEE